MCWPIRGQENRRPICFYCSSSSTRCCRSVRYQRLRVNMNLTPVLYWETAWDGICHNTRVCAHLSCVCSVRTRKNAGYCTLEWIGSARVQCSALYHLLENESELLCSTGHRRSKWLDWKCTFCSKACLGHRFSQTEQSSHSLFPQVIPRNSQQCSG